MAEVARRARRRLGAVVRQRLPVPLRQARARPRVVAEADVAACAHAVDAGGAAVAVGKEETLMPITTDVQLTEGRLNGVALAPCPFCGDTSLVLDSTVRDGYEQCQADPDAHAFAIRCGSCAATGGWGKSVGRALGQWNMRTR